MKKILDSLWVLAPVVGAVAAWAISRNESVTAATLVVLLLPAIVKIYIPYAKDNPNHLWFKRKLYGWGWTPVTWQGWLITLGYIAIVLGLVLATDLSSSREIGLLFIVPVAILTAAFLRICYKKGEKPRWQWGPEKDDEDKG